MTKPKLQPLVGERDSKVRLAQSKLQPVVADLAVLQEQFAESARLEGEIKKNLAGFGFNLIVSADDEANA